MKVGLFHVVEGRGALMPSPHYSYNYLISYMKTLRNGKDTFLAGMEKEMGVFESFWEGTEVGVGFVE